MGCINSCHVILHHMTTSKTSSHPQAILAGSIAIDRIMNFSGKFEDMIQPDKLHVLSLSVLLDQVEDTHGGVAANIAYSLALLGDQPTLLGSVGENGRSFMDQLAKLGVNTQHVHYSKQPTASFTVMTDSNDCQVGGFYPGAMSDDAGVSLVEVVQLQSDLDQAKTSAKKSHSTPTQTPLIVISAHDPNLMRQQVAACAEQNWPLFYDVSQQVSNIPAADIRAGLEAAQLLIVNDFEMGVIEKKTKLSAEEIRAMVPTIVITLGEKGSQVFHKSEQLPAVPAVPNLKVVDPTGAGDAFRAGFIFGYVRDWPLDQACRLGSVTAAFAIEKRGTQQHHFTREKVAARFEQAYSDRLNW
jgi:adenosine kinase